MHYQRINETSVSIIKFRAVSLIPNRKATKIVSERSSGRRPLASSLAQHQLVRVMFPSQCPVCGPKKTT